MFDKSEINKKYFEDKNFKRLMAKLYDHFSKSFNYKVSDDEEELCKFMMYKIYSHNTPNEKESRVQFIKRLNRTCVIELIKIVTSKINKMNGATDLVRNDILQEQGDNLQNHVANFPKPQPAGIKNKDVASNFNALNKMREQEMTKVAPIKRPEFEIKMEESNEDILKAFEETQKKFDKERQEYEKSKKIITDQNGNELVIKDNEPLNTPMAANEMDGSNIDKIITEDNKIIKTEDFEKNQLLIPQPKQYAKVMKDIYDTTTKDYYIVIDSRDRNHNLFSNPNNYQIEFDNVLRSIISIELISAELPAVQYNINANNNILHFSEGGDTLTAEITIGQYDVIDDLRSAIQTALNSADGSSGGYVVSVSTITRKMTIANGGISFSLLFNGGTETFVQSQTRTKYLANSIGSVIGFSRNDTSSAASHTGDNQYNLSGENYVLLYIKELENLESVSGNSTIHDTFTKINLDVNSSNNIKFYNQLDEYISRVSFVPPLASIGQMIIKFYNYDGSFYDFGGREHSLYFKITTFNQPTSYYQG